MTIQERPQVPTLKTTLQREQRHWQELPEKEKEKREERRRVTEATEQEEERKDEEEHKKELQQQKKEGDLRQAEIREVSRNRKRPKEEEVQILANAPRDRAIVMNVMRSVTVEEARSRIRSELRCWSGDECTMLGRKVSRASWRSKDGGAIDGSVVHLMERLRGGGEHERKRKTNVERELNEPTGSSELCGTPRPSGRN